MKNILALSGSLSSGSINHQLLEVAAAQVQGLGVRLVSLRDFPMPLYSSDLEQEGIPAQVRELRGLFDAADGFIIAVPEYNSSVPAGFKNAIDWISRTGGKPFQEKPVLLMSTSPGGRGGASVQQHLLRVLPFWGAQVVGIFSLPRFNEHLVEGKLNEAFQGPLNEALDSLREALA